MFALKYSQNRIKNIWSSSIRLLSSQKRNSKEVAIKVPWGHVRGKWWEPFDVRPIVASHGWQVSIERLWHYLLNPNMLYSRITVALLID